jgi:Tol biopolymer transport system component
MDGSPAVRLGPGYPLGLSPDGAWVAILGDGVSNRGVSNKLTLVPTGAGTPRTIDLPHEFRRLNPLGRERESFHVEFSADSRRLMVPSDGAENLAARIYVIDLQEGWTRPVTPEGVPGPAAFSPDGRSVAVIEATQLVLYSVDDGTRRVLPGGPEPALVARWSSDGRSLLLIETRGATARVLRRHMETGAREFLREVRVSDPAGVVFLDVWVSRDAQAYAYSAGRRTMNLFVVEGLR